MYYKLSLVVFFSIMAQPLLAQIIPPQERTPVLTQTVSFKTETPEKILGERKMKVSSNFLFLSGQEPLVYLIYHRSKDALTGIATLADAQRQGYGINRTYRVNNKWETILPHSGVARDAFNNTNKIEFKGGEQVFYRWLLVSSDGRNILSPVAGFEMPRPMNIAILGDSYGSGEGAASQGLLWVAGISGNNCHRSENAGQFQAVKQFAANNPHIAIVYKPFFISCSGATTIKLISEPYNTDFCNKVPGSPDEVPQLTQLRNIFANPQKFKEDIQGKIDVLLVSIGGNDAGFADAVMEAFQGNLATGISFYSKGAREIIPESYKELKKAVEAECIQYVFTSHYPDPTKGNNGITCGLPGNALEFLFNAYFESLMGGTETLAQGICNAGNAVVNFFTGGNTDLGCNNLDAFPTPNYDMVMEHLRCNLPVPGGPNVNLANGDFINASRIAQGITSLINIIASSPDLNSFLNNLMNGCIPADGMPSDLNLFATLLATRADITAARVGYLLPMDSVITAKSLEFKNAGFTNWHVVDSVLTLSENHGMCRCEGNQRYFHSLMSSYDQQGTKDGTMHMNNTGQLNVYKPAVLSKLTRIITLEERRNMLNNATTCVPASEPYKVSRGYESLLTNRALEKEARENRRESDYTALRIALKPIIDIVNKMDPKKFGDQYKSKAFKSMRETRLKK